MAFEDFVADAVVTAGNVGDGESLVTSSHPLLNGVPYSVFRREVSIESRREIGAFFSGDVIAKSLAKTLAGHVDDDALVLDPTCGIGDLLLARAAYLPLGPTLAETLAAWGERLAGFDIRKDLVSLCKARLCMLARARGGFADEIDPLRMFPHIVERDIFSKQSEALLGCADAILFNPPFGKTTWTKKLDWSSGEINAAAIFLDRLTATVRPIVPIAAVLPEVLRCGSRYARFRAVLIDRGYAGSFEVQGRFDAWTDVDVFTTIGGLQPEFLAVGPEAFVLAGIEHAGPELAPEFRIFGRPGIGGIDEDPVMLALNLIKRAVHRGAKSGVGRNDRAVRLEFDDSERLRNSVHHTTSIGA